MIRLMICAAASTALLASSCAAPSKPAPAAAANAGELDAKARCAALAGSPIAKSTISLPTSGGRLDTTEWTTGEYCKVIGSIAPIDPAAPQIRFQVNLPKSWNGKGLQCGGGGLNGNLVSCENPLRDAPPVETPLARGYATFGTDGGHQNSPDKDLQSFALNDEALINHAYGAYKKTYDASKALIRSFYGRAPARMYFFGGSEGGREGLIGAQRNPEDYDGIVSTVPLIGWIGVNLAGYQQYELARADGWMNAAKVKLVHDTTLAACDRNDGLADGMIAKYIGCNSGAQIKALRCSGGRDTGDACLSDAQIALVELVRAPTPYGFAVNNGETDYPGYAIGGEALPGAMIPTIVAPTKPSPTDLGRNVYAAGDMRYFILKDPTYIGPIDYKKYEKRIREVSALMDMNDPNLARFKARGGKLIMKSNSADYLVSPGALWRYYERVVSTMGQASADQFVRLYVAPWTGHGGSGIAGDGAPTPDRVDLLAALEAWVERGEAPADQMSLTSYNQAKAPVASWPMCRYPNYPHYSGSGDAKQAASYTCRSAK
jgi:Tannase and feruloyl esterase